MCRRSLLRERPWQVLYITGTQASPTSIKDARAEAKDKCTGRPFAKDFPGRPVPVHMGFHAAARALSVATALHQLGVTNLMRLYVVDSSATRRHKREVLFTVAPIPSSRLVEGEEEEKRPQQKVAVPRLGCEELPLQGTPHHHRNEDRARDGGYEQHRQHRNADVELDGATLARVL